MAKLEGYTIRLQQGDEINFMLLAATPKLPKEYKEAYLWLARWALYSRTAPYVKAEVYSRMIKDIEDGKLQRCTKFTQSFVDRVYGADCQEYDRATKADNTRERRKKAAAI